MKPLEDTINRLDARDLADIGTHLLGFVNPDRVARIDRILSRRTRFVTAVLENVFQSHNASAVVRSCDCFGVQDLHVIESCNRFDVHRRIVQGAAKWITIHRYRQPDASFRCLAGLRDAGYRVVAMSPDPDAVPLDELPLDAPVALCFGSEDPGLSDTARSMAERFASIPMQGFTQSLNLSVSAGIALNQIAPRVRKEVKNWRLEPRERERLRALWLARSVTSGAQIVHRRLAGARD